MAKMAAHAVMSRAEIDEATLAEVAEACKLPTTQIEDIYACTPQQLDQIAESRSEMFQIVLSFSLAADIDRWCKAVRQVVSLNSVLRTRIVCCRLGIVQIVTSEEHVTERLSGNAEEYLRDEERLGFGVPLFRSAFVGRTFVATMHHAIMDYWSLNTFLSEDVAGFYLGHPPKKHPPFKDFVTRCMSIDEPAARSFWASRFKGIPTIFPKVDPDIPTYPSGEDKRKITLKRIDNGASPSHIPWFAEAAWALTAATYADSDSVAYGLVLSGRTPSPNGVETTLGPTVAEVPVQVNLQRNMTVERLIKDRATSLRQLTTNPDFLQYGTPRISAVSEAARTASRFQSLFNVVPPQPISLPTTEEESQAVRLDRVVYQARGSFSLMLLCRILDGEVSLETRYDPAVLSERQLHRVLNQFEHILQSLIGAPLQTKLEKLQLLNPYDRLEILSWNAGMPEITRKCLHEVFSARARAQPEAMAIEASDGSASYSEVDQMSDRLACELGCRGVLTGKTVAFIFEKSLWAIVAILGIMKVGGVCVSIDKDDPYERKADTISKVHAKTVLTSSTQYASSAGLAPSVFAVSSKSIAGLPEVAGLSHDGLISSENLAYIAFTSGSTGARKRVMLEHRCLVSTITSLAQRLDWKPSCRMLQFGTHASNSSICEIFGALLFGGCLCIPSEEAQASNLSGFIKSARANWALLPPSVLRTLSPSDVPGLGSLLSIGEHVDVETAEIWSKSLRFFNGWGACEASILDTVAALTPKFPYPDSIGVPVGCAIWIVNPRNVHELVPIGSVGELLIEGPGVAKGYVDDKMKTMSSFIPPPLCSSSYPRDSTRFFRSGDLARYEPDGSLSYIGRLDNRVRINGQTVQLEEIESAIANCSKVRDVVTLTKIATGRTQLVSIVCLADPQLPRRTVLQELSGAFERVANEQLDTVRTHAKSKLSVDNIPSLWVVVERLPRTASQKLDRAAVREWLKALRR